jgi:GrpB-like predicted nucleotidyltransferase (UPF0157 family)
MPTVIIHDHDPAWFDEFSRTADEIRSTTPAGFCRLEHIGSTSVPGLCAKPIIDILLGARTLSDIDKEVLGFQAIGFRYVQEHEEEFPERRYFVRAPDTRLRVNLYAVVEGSPFWVRHLGFRDLLRSDIALRKEYGDLKRNLAGRYPEDRPAYTAAKGPFIGRALERLQSAA